MERAIVCCDMQEAGRCLVMSHGSQQVSIEEEVAGCRCTEQD